MSMSESDHATLRGDSTVTWCFQISILLYVTASYLGLVWGLISTVVIITFAFWAGSDAEKSYCKQHKDRGK